jgi:hypothetical protein
MSYSTIFTNLHTTRDIRESRPPVSGVGMTSIKVGTEEISFNVAIESEELAEMARRAASNKSQSSKFGALRVEVISRRRL